LGRRNSGNQFPLLGDPPNTLAERVFPPPLIFFFFFLVIFPSILFCEVPVFCDGSVGSFGPAPICWDSLRRRDSVPPFYLFSFFPSFPTFSHAGSTPFSHFPLQPSLPPFRPSTWDLFFENPLRFFLRAQESPRLLQFPELSPPVSRSSPSLVNPFLSGSFFH